MFLVTTLFCVYIFAHDFFTFWRICVPGRMFLIELLFSWSSPAVYLVATNAVFTHRRRIREPSAERLER